MGGSSSLPRYLALDPHDDEAGRRIIVTREGAARVDLPPGYDMGQVEALRDAVVALFPGQEVRIVGS